MEKSSKCFRYRLLSISLKVYQEIREEMIYGVSHILSRRWAETLLTHYTGDFKYGHQECNRNRADDQAHECDHERFDQRRCRTDGVLELFGQKNRNLVANLADLPGFLTGPHHLNDTRGD